MLIKAGVVTRDNFVTYVCPITQWTVAVALSGAPMQAEVAPPNAVECRLLVV